MQGCLHVFFKDSHPGQFSQLGNESSLKVLDERSKYKGLAKQVSIISIYLLYLSTYKLLFVPMSPFHARTTGPISTEFCIVLHTNSGKVLNTGMTLPTQPPDPGVPKQQNLNR